MTTPTQSPARRGDSTSGWLLKQAGAGLLAALLVPGAGIGTLWLGGGLYSALIAILTTLVGLGFVFRRQLLTMVLLGLIGVVVALFQLVTGGSVHAEGAEGEQMLSSMSGHARVAYTTQGQPKHIRTLTGPVGSGECGVAPNALQGKYFRVRDEVIIANDNTFILTAEPILNSRDGFGTLTSNWSGGDGVFTWNP